VLFTGKIAVKLTQATIATIELRPDQSERIVFDERLPGFGLRLRADGKRTWIVQYRIAKKQRRMTLGSVEMMMAGQAYAAAEHVLSQVKVGADPQARKREERAHAAMTLHAISERFLRYKEGQLKDQSFKQMRIHLTKHWSPLNIISIGKITKGDVAAQLGKIAEERGPFAANRARATLSSLFTWAVKEGLVDINPVSGTNRQTDDQPRDRILTDAEIATIWNACRQDDYGLIIRLLIVTAQRRDEVGGIAKSEVDFKAGRWAVPSNRTHNGLMHEVPLSGLAVGILQQAILRDGRVGRDLIFGNSNSGRSFSGWSKAKLALDERIEEATQLRPFWEVRNARAAVTWSMDPPVEDMVLVKPWSWRVHDIRRVAAARMADLGVVPHIIDAVLNNRQKHRRIGVQNRSFEAEKRQALDVWAAYLQRLVNSSAAPAVSILVGAADDQRS
jgi:integrase